MTESLVACHSWELDVGGFCCRPSYALLRSQYNHSMAYAIVSALASLSLVDVFVWRCHLPTKASCGLAWQTWAQHIAQPIPPIYPKSCLSHSQVTSLAGKWSMRALLSHGATKWVPKERTVSKEESYRQSLHQRSLAGMYDPDIDSIKDRLAIQAALFCPKTHKPD